MIVVIIVPTAFPVPGCGKLTIRSRKMSTSEASDQSERLHDRHSQLDFVWKNNSGARILVLECDGSKHDKRWDVGASKTLNLDDFR